MFDWPTAYLSIESNILLESQPISWLIGHIAIYKDGSLTMLPSADGYFDFGSCRNIAASVANHLFTLKTHNRMAKKIETIPLPKDNFLAGYKPIVPHFADDDESSADENISTPKLAIDEKEYADIFLKAPDSSKRVRVVYVSAEHLECLKTIARFLKNEYGTAITVSALVANILEHHFRTYGKIIGTLIDKSRPTMPDRFK